MTRKELQRTENEMIEMYLDDVCKEIEEQGGLRNWKRLRYCSAEVAETENYYVLRSYNTLIGFINKREDKCFDVLRKVYGYTATSAQHISKFDKDYGKGTWGCVERFTWRYVG